jgi:hypothetical protein
LKLFAPTGPNHQHPPLTIARKRSLTVLSSLPLADLYGIPHNTSHTITAPNQPKKRSA